MARGSKQADIGSGERRGNKRGRGGPEDRTKLGKESRFINILAEYLSICLQPILDEFPRSLQAHRHTGHKLLLYFKLI